MSKGKGISKFSKEEITDAVIKSRSISEAVKNLGKCRSGQQTKRLKEIIFKYEIDTSHFIDSRSKDLERIFNNEISIKTHSLRNKLIKEKLKKEKCEICGISEWNGKKIRVELHHIDGNNKNNNFSNLQNLCPNCHSQTDNHSVNKKYIRYSSKIF